MSQAVPSDKSQPATPNRLLAEGNSPSAAIDTSAPVVGLVPVEAGTLGRIATEIKDTLVPVFHAQGVSGRESSLGQNTTDANAANAPASSAESNAVGQEANNRDPGAVVQSAEESPYKVTTDKSVQAAPPADPISLDEDTARVAGGDPGIQPNAGSVVDLEAQAEAGGRDFVDPLTQQRDIQKIMSSVAAPSELAPIKERSGDLLSQLSDAATVGTVLGSIPAIPLSESLASGSAPQAVSSNWMVNTGATQVEDPTRGSWLGTVSPQTSDAASPNWAGSTTPHTQNPAAQSWVDMVRTAEPPSQPSWVDPTAAVGAPSGSGPTNDVPAAAPQHDGAPQDSSSWVGYVSERTPQSSPTHDAGAGHNPSGSGGLSI